MYCLTKGTTSHETDLFPPLGTFNWTWNDYEQYVTDKLTTFSSETATMAMRLYPRGMNNPEYQITSMISDIRMTCGNDVLAMYAAVNSVSPVYRYIITANPSVRTRWGGKYSFHGLDLFAYFGTLSSILPHMTYEDWAFQYNIRREVTSFVQGGSPSSGDWLGYPHATVLLSEKTMSVASYHSAECLFWAKNGFIDYSWIN